MPALKTGKALGTMAVGERIEVACTDPMAAIDIPHLVRQRGDVLEHAARDEAVLIFRIRRA